jgi:hypothetical protein
MTMASTSAPSGDLKSQNGWPASASPDAIDVVNFTVKFDRGGPATVPLARFAAAPLLRMAEWWDANIEPVQVIYGYNFRNVRGASAQLSNHASGSAIDINPEKHPLESGSGTGVSETGAKAVGTIPSGKVAGLRAKAAELGLRWGGDYPGRKDEMHFEVITPPPPAVLAKPNSFYVLGDDGVPFYKEPLFWVGTVAVLTAVGVGVAVWRHNRR